MPPLVTVRPLVKLFSSLFDTNICIQSPLVCHFVFLPIHFKDLKPSANGKWCDWQIGGKAWH